jgi:hypothetical protein
LNKAPRKRRALASDGNDFSVVQLRALLMRLSLGRTLELSKGARESEKLSPLASLAPQSARLYTHRITWQISFIDSHHPHLHRPKWLGIGPGLLSPMEEAPLF